MSSFTSPLVVTPLPGGRTWELRRSFSYHVGSRNSRNVIKVPKGFITDFASTDVLQWLAIFSTAILAVLLLAFKLFTLVMPIWGIYIYMGIVLLAILITPYGKQSKGAVLHDYLYCTHQVSRAMADLIFYESMCIGNTERWKAKLMYYGVRIGAWIAWR